MQMIGWQEVALGGQRGLVCNNSSWSGSFKETRQVRAQDCACQGEPRRPLWLSHTLGPGSFVLSAEDWEHQMVNNKIILESSRAWIP